MATGDGSGTGPDLTEGLLMTDTKGFVTIRLEDSVREQLEALAKEGERSLSAEIRLAIREHLKNGGKP